jgi:putative transposase
MSEYRRIYCEGGWYFFTVVTHNREKILTQPANITRLRQSFHLVKGNYPFYIDAIVILPDHIHCIWRLPPEDSNFSVRWKLIKRYFSLGMAIPSTTHGEKKVWQRRFWEHLLRNEKDWHAHMDYIHYNPVKHGYVKSPRDWRYSSFHNAVKRGLYVEDWGAAEPSSIHEMNIE